MYRPISRRECLRTGLSTLGVMVLNSWDGVGWVAQAATTTERITRAREILKAIIIEHATTRDNPWLLMHGILAMGNDFTVGQERAVDYICRRYLREKTVNGKSYFYMPITDEGHINAFLSEAVLDVGIDPSHAFRSNDRDYTIADLIAGAKALFSFNAGSVNPDDLAWSLIVFAYSTDPAQDEWINGYGTPVRFSDVVEFGLNTLEKTTTRYQDAMRKGLLADEPDGIHSFTCAGIHLIHGLSTCLRLGHTRNDLAERMKVQFDILVWRLKSDSRLIDRYYNAVAGQYSPEVARIYYLDAKLKLLGHAFQVINQADKFGLFAPTFAQKEDIGRAQQELLDVVNAIGPEAPKKFVDDEVLFHFLVGDACHAYRGLTMIGQP
jgi:hypothetical protein